MSAQPQTLAELRQQQGTNASGTAVAAPRRTMAEIGKMPKPKQFPAMLEALQGEIRRALPAHLNADRMARIALTCFRTTPKLALCEPASVFAAVLQAAQLGLEPGLLGQCYLIPYKDQCQLQIGYQGLVDLARRTGRIVSLEAHAVYAKDKWRCSFGMNTVVEHEPFWDGDRGDFRLAYAVAHLKDGGTHVEVMTRSEIEAIRDRSQNVQSAKRFGKTTPWDTDFSEMARKTVLRRITKTLPKSVELATALALDAASNDTRGQQLNIDDAIEGTWVHVEPTDDAGEGEHKEHPSERVDPTAPADADINKSVSTEPAAGDRKPRKGNGPAPAAGTTGDLVE